MTVEWLRDGEPIADATDSTYATTVDDLGRRIAARMTLTREGYAPFVERTRAIGTIRTEPRLKVRAKRPGRGKVRFTIQLRARGLDEVPGRVQLRWHGKVLKDFDLRHGYRVVTLRHLPSGEQTFKVKYLRTDTVLKSVQKKTYRVK